MFFIKKFKYLYSLRLTLFAVGFAVAVLNPVFQSSLFGIEKKSLQVVVDNDKIQRYQGIIGRWVLPGRSSLTSIAREFGTTVEKIREINGGAVSAGSYAFVPMSRERFNGYIHEGEGRRVFEVDSRRYIWPVERPGYTSRFGMRHNRMHEGLDISCAIGTVIFAAKAGEVVRVGVYGAMGRAVAVRHDDGMETWYGHNSALLVKEGDRVERGQILAYSGNTGRSTGPHLHFEVRYLNISLNPEDFLPYGYSRPDLVIREGDFITEPVADRTGEESALNQYGSHYNLQFLD